MGQLPDVLDVVEEAVTLYHFNTLTNNLNGEIDEAEMETNNCQRGGGKHKHEPSSGDEGMQTQTQN